MLKKIKNFFFYEDQENITFKERFIKFITNPKEVISFIIPLLLMLSLLLPVPYYIITGGGTMPLNEKIEIKDGYDSKGSLSSAYVSQINGNVFTYLLSYILPSYEKEKVEDVILNNEEEEDYSFREKLYFKNSLSTAMKVAFTYANEKIEKQSEENYIIYIDPKANTTLKSQDQILKVEDIKITTTNDISKALEKYAYKDEINIEVKRDGKIVNTVSKFVLIDNERKIGISLMNHINYQTSKDIKFKFSKREEGPSGGLMIALDIYNQLTEYDITKGREIVGTGTISEDGTVGEIGGVKYKLLGAEKAKADIFLVPEENYAEALKIKKDKKYKIEIIKVHTFKEALEVLK